MAEKEIILNVKVQTNTEAAIKQIMELNTQIEREKNLQKEYNQWLKEGTVSWEEYNREMELSKQHVTEYSTKIRALRKEIQNNIHNARHGKILQRSFRIPRRTKNGITKIIYSQRRHPQKINPYIQHRPIDQFRLRVQKFQNTF